MHKPALAVATTILLWAGAADAQPPSPVRLEILSRSEAFGGAAFGPVGPYQRLTGVAHLEIDPKIRANAGIVDLDRAPRDARGMVHYDVDIEILRPQDPAKGRRVLVYDVVNRGMKLITAMLGGSQAGSDITKGSGGFLMRQGYTIVWSGWQGDVTSPQLIGARLPTATDHDRAITGRIVTERIFDDASSKTMTLPYPTSTQVTGSAWLTVRSTADGPERRIPPADWHFDDDRHITLMRPADSDAGAIYRLSYLARDPKVMGLGFAATRDVVAFLNHGRADEGNPLADLAAAPCERNALGSCAPARGVFDVVVGFGASQSGRFLRDFLWQGFNRDLAGRPVFDGVIPFIAGGRRTFTNFRFSDPGRFSRQHEDHDAPGFGFPFTYGTLRDPVTGRTDGILARCQADGTCPKVFHIDTSGEFWQAGASLVGTGGTGHDVALPANVRAYMIAGGSHAPGVTMPACRAAADPLDYAPAMRAVLVDMVDWISGRQPPPISRWPRIGDATLVALDALNHPDLSAAGLEWPKVVNRPIAPSGYETWPVLVPTVDADGNDVAGIHLPEEAAPAGTYLGWNVRKAGYAQGELCSIIGSFLPFAASQSSRGSDPRLSLAERYAAMPRSDEMQAIGAKLRRERLLIDGDR